jgi:hypothetical protein
MSFLPMVDSERLLVEALGAINLALDPASIRRRGSRAEIELLASARRRTVTALDVVLADELLWRRERAASTADSPVVHPAEWIGDRVTDLLVRSGHRPPPPAGEIVADVRQAVATMGTALGRKSRRRASARTQRALVALRDALAAVPAHRPARRLLRQARSAVVPLAVLVATGMAQNAAYDVAKDQLFDLVADRAEQAVAPGMPTDLQRAIQESMYREQLSNERWAEAEAEAAELAVDRQAGSSQSGGGTVRARP